MVLIISNELDNSTNEVIAWLHHQNKKYLRINETDTITIESLNINHATPDILFRVNNGKVLNTKDISSYWYRRGGIYHNHQIIKNIVLSDSLLNAEIVHNVKNDLDICVSFFIDIIEKKTKIGSMINATNNKLIHLALAQSLNIKTPLSLITTKKADYFSIKKRSLAKEIITKSISDGFHHFDKKDSWALYTKVISGDIENSLPVNFPLTLLQEKINKKWELRIFYLKGKFYSMAIFSQNDKKTEIDFRKYNTVKPNYRVPYQLPKNIEKKLHQFMIKADLNTGSIDMIYSKEGDYYFLEVNPVGQFGMVSYPCNYYLEKEIASILF